MVVDGAGADEQLGGDFLVGGPVGSEAGDLCFLGGQVIARLGRKGLSERYGWPVKLESKAGAGTIATISFPSVIPA